MIIIKRFFATPWSFIRFFLLIALIVPGVVFTTTLFTGAYPGWSAELVASAADLWQAPDLSFPIFRMITRMIAGVTTENLTLYLNIFSVVCGTLSAGLFYLMTARLIFMLAHENPGGAMAALPPAAATLNKPTPKLVSPAVPLPPDVQKHNWHAAFAAVIGGLAATSALVFSAPYWITATRLFPFTFHLLLLFGIINLVITYDQRGWLWSMFLGVILLTLFCTESTLFLLALPIGGTLLLRAAILNHHATLRNILLATLLGVAGITLSLVFLWHAASYCASITYPGPRAIVNTFTATILNELLSWIPRHGWSYSFVQVLFPVTISFYVFSRSFKIRTPSNLLLQLILCITLIPRLLNLAISPWGIARANLNLPVYSYTITALLIGLLIGSWYMMIEIFEHDHDNELDYYEYRDNPLATRIGFTLCIPLLLLALISPFFNYKDIKNQYGLFADKAAHILYQQLGARHWLANNTILPHHLMLIAQQDKRTLNFITVYPMQNYSASPSLVNYIHEHPEFENHRCRLLNAAALSTSIFVEEWFKHEPTACEQVAFFDLAGYSNSTNLITRPAGFYYSKTPGNRNINLDNLLHEHQAIITEIQPHLFPAKPDSIHLFRTIRQHIKQHLALISNELAVLFYQQNRSDAALEILKQAARFDPENLSVMLNHYTILLRSQKNTDHAQEYEALLKQFQPHIDTYTLDLTQLQLHCGTLISLESIEYVRDQGTAMRYLVSQSAGSGHDILLTLRDKKVELHNSITRHIEQNEIEDADRQLNFLLDLDTGDTFALLSKARIAIEKRNLPEAGLWIDLAKEAGVPDQALGWHHAALLYIKGELDQARKLVETYIITEPENTLMWELLSDILLELKEYNELGTRIFPVLNSRSNRGENYRVHILRGYLLKQEGSDQYRAARDAFVTALRINPDLPHIQEEILELDYLLDIPAFCESDAKHVLRTNPEHAFANYLWGSVRLRRGEIELAEDLFLRSLEKQRNAQAYAGLGAVMLQREEYEKANILLNTSLEIDKNNPFALFTMAKLLLATRKLDEAEQLLQDILSKKPDNPEVQITWIKLLIEQKKVYQAAMLTSQMLKQKERWAQYIQAQLTEVATHLSSEIAP